MLNTIKVPFSGDNFYINSRTVSNIILGMMDENDMNNDGAILFGGHPSIVDGKEFPKYRHLSTVMLCDDDTFDSALSPLILFWHDALAERRLGHQVLFRDDPRRGIFYCRSESPEFIVNDELWTFDCLMWLPERSVSRTKMFSRRVRMELPNLWKILNA